MTLCWMHNTIGIELQMTLCHELVEEMITIQIIAMNTEQYYLYVFFPVWEYISWYQFVLTVIGFVPAFC